MSLMASQITSLTVVYSTAYSDADQRKHQSSASLAFVWGIHRDRWIPRTKGQLRGICFHIIPKVNNVSSRDTSHIFCKWHCVTPVEAETKYEPFLNEFLNGNLRILIHILLNFVPMVLTDKSKPGRLFRQCVSLDLNELPSTPARYSHVYTLLWGWFECGMWYAEGYQSKWFLLNLLTKSEGRMNNEMFLFHKV